MKIVLILLLTISISLNAGIISGYERACNNNSGGNCHALGRLYEIGGGTLGGKFIQVQKDYKIASMYYRKACDAGDDFGCNEIGYMYQTGKGVTQNIQKAKDAYSYPKSNYNKGYLTVFDNYFVSNQRVQIQIF